MSESSLNLKIEKTLGYRTVRLMVVIVWRIMFRPRVVGAENIPSTGPVLLAPIHRSNIDFAYLVFATERKTFFMGKDSLWKIRPIGALIQLMGAFPVKRGTADRESLKNAQQVLNEGQALVLFPEGTRQEGDLVGPLFEGAMFIASRVGAPVIPVGLGNTEKAMRKGAWLPRPVRTTVVIGKPIQAPTSESRVTRSELNAATEQLRVGLQEAYDLARELLN
jgi:1-acyl-sn-glycerol-3-phosphate acyltransferase